MDSEKLRNNIPDKSGDTVRFMHISDTHLWPEKRRQPFGTDGHDPIIWNSIWEMLPVLKPDAILWSGDIAAGQDWRAYQIANSPEGPLKHTISDIRYVKDFNIPVYSVPGNHDHYVVFWKIFFYVRSRILFRKFFQKSSCPSLNVFKKKNIQFNIFRIDSSSGINTFDRMTFSAGCIHKRDLTTLKHWREIARNGGKINEIKITPEILANSWNILVIHHELTKNRFYSDISKKSKIELIKLIAQIPIHVIACGHLHEQKISYYPLFGPGRLNKKKNWLYMKNNNMLSAEHVRISRAGSTCEKFEEENTMNLIDFDKSSFSIKTLIFDKKRKIFILNSI
ncbi:MAG: metallophosphoesterase [bacterium]